MLPYKTQHLIFTNHIVQCSNVAFLTNNLLTSYSDEKERKIKLRFVGLVCVSLVMCIRPISDLYCNRNKSHIKSKCVTP